MTQCKGYPHCGCVDGSCGDDINHAMAYISCDAGRKVLPLIRPPCMGDIMGMKVNGYVGGDAFGDYISIQLKDDGGNLYNLTPVGKKIKISPQKPFRG